MSTSTPSEKENDTGDEHVIESSDSTSPSAMGETPLDRILDAEREIRELNRNARPWPEGRTADDLIEEARKERTGRRIVE